jgi:hypothetical protein
LIEHGIFGASQRSVEVRQSLRRSHIDPDSMVVLGASAPGRNGRAQPRCEGRARATPQVAKKVGSIHAQTGEC